MDTKKTIRRLKPYKNMLIVTLLVSGVIGLALFLQKKSKGVILIGSLLPLLSALFQILFLEREFATLLSLSLILLSIIYYTSFQLFSKSLTAIKNLHKGRASSYNTFIILLAFVSFVTISGLQYSFVVKYRIDKKQALRGVSGRIGERGEQGSLAINITDEKIIIYQNSSKYAENIFVVALRQRYPEKQFTETKKYFNNILMKQSIENAIQSWGFNSIMLDLRKRYLEDSKNKSLDKNELCKLDETNQDKIIKALQQMMQNEINEWITIFSKYENGFLFLQDTLLLETSWNTLYTNRDKLNKLPESPFVLLRKRDIWLWNELTKKEYLDKIHTVELSCNTQNTNCSAKRLMNNGIIYYPSVIKNDFGFYEVITNSNVTTK
jgi:hypothetical protein